MPRSWRGTLAQYAGGLHSVHVDQTGGRDLRLRRCGRTAASQNGQQARTATGPGLTTGFMRGRVVRKENCLNFQQPGRGNLEIIGIGGKVRMDDAIREQELTS